MREIKKQWKIYLNINSLIYKFTIVQDNSNKKFRVSCFWIRNMDLQPIGNTKIDNRLGNVVLENDKKMRYRLRDEFRETS